VNDRLNPMEAITTRSPTGISLLALGDRPESYAFRLFKAILEAKGYRVNLVYLNIARLDSPITFTPALQEQLLRLVRSSSIVALYVFTFNFDLAVEITRYIRAHTNALILWGGPHAIAEPEECAQYADIVCINEGEQALPAIVEKYEIHGADFDRTGIANAAYMLKGEMRYNPIERLNSSLDSLPYQDLSLVNHYYVDNANNIVPLTLEDMRKAGEGVFRYITMISRGCPFRCTFCLNSNEHRIPYYVGRSVDNVIGELKEAKRRFGGQMDEVMFYDDDLFALPAEYIADFSAKYKEHIDIPIAPVNASAVSFREDKLIQLKNAGIMGVIVGIQTISTNGRKSYHNPANKDRISRIMEVMKRHSDMRTVLHIMLGNPYENEDDIAENLLFLNSLPKIYDLSPYNLIIYPGTKLVQRIRNDPVHRTRAREGYRLPYYYCKPEMRSWSHLAMAYPGRKREFPGYIRYLLEGHYYTLLKCVAFLGRVRTRIRRLHAFAKEHGLLTTLKKVGDKLSACIHKVDQRTPRAEARRR